MHDWFKFLQVSASVCKILLTLTIELRVILPNVRLAMVGYIVIRISPSNIFLIML